MSKFKLSKPSPGGDKWDKAAHIDHRHLFIADEFVATSMSTSFGDSAAVHVDNVVCVDCREVWADLMIFGAALVPRLDGCEPYVVVGRLGQGWRKSARRRPRALRHIRCPQAARRGRAAPRSGSGQGAPGGTPP